MQTALVAAGRPDSFPRLTLCFCCCACCTWPLLLTCLCCRFTFYKSGQYYK